MKKKRLAEHAFINLKLMTTEDKKKLGKHLIEIGYKLARDTSGKTVDDVMSDMKNVLIQLKRLKEHYEDKNL